MLSSDPPSSRAFSTRQSLAPARQQSLAPPAIAATPRAAPPPAPALSAPTSPSARSSDPGTETIPSTIPLDKMHRSCVEFQARFDEWFAMKKRALAEDKAAHLKKCHEIKETQAQLKKQIELQNAKVLELQITCEKEGEEVAAANSEREELKLSSEERVEQKMELLAQRRELARELHRRKEELQRKRQAQLDKHNELEPELQGFVQHLALELKCPEPDVVQFIFTHVNERNWEKEYSFSVDFSTRTYRVTSCVPILPNLDRLLAWVNTSRDFYSFLKEMRKEFAEYAKSES
ncbi:chromosome segregation protein Spc25-domain-containing protein [Blyttiomyces helicus]|uniref:Kinetochore protein SPC25 n=1 Tax=Blyttiomyces helicus TaxID=388810 RepID=A0A4P9VTK6_9FUNG|nr:chromosome segregation protein Spc25-domain-containing protein [Blyttiomyces helicus]|eukprot:RKO82859.1 chromosome segregation protein Spc25-domain-containing protein [Blyttiomyces helicus]